MRRTSIHAFRHSATQSAGHKNCTKVISRNVPAGAQLGRQEGQHEAESTKAGDRRGPSKITRRAEPQEARTSRNLVESEALAVFGQLRAHHFTNFCCCAKL